MQCVSSYAVEIKKQNIPIRHTLGVYGGMNSDSVMITVANTPSAAS